MRFAQWKILDALHEKAEANKEAPSMGFREIQRNARVGTQNLIEHLDYLVKNRYVATTTVGAYPRYIITEQGKIQKESLHDVISIEELFNRKPKTMRLPSGRRSDPTGTLLYKNISFSELQSVFIPAWEKLVDEVTKKLENRNCEIGFVGTIKHQEKSPTRAAKKG
jgi:hypothetical protein